MKKIIVFLSILTMCLAALSQTPQAIKYQAMARNSDGDPVINQEISLKISILAGNPEGEVVYNEQHIVETNGMALFSVQIGNPTVLLSGTFNEIDWGASDFFMKLEMDENAGSNYQHMGTSQLLSVPYSLNSGSLTLTDDNGNNYNISVDSSGNLYTTIIEIEWQCGDPVVDERDGQTYQTVQIGVQCWMAENLNIGTMVNGSGNQTDNGIIEKYCYNNNTSNCDNYGGLYQWDEVMQYYTTEGVQGICPPTGGWYLPTDADWCTLEQEVDPIITCSSTGFRGVDGGGKLKENGTIHWNSPNNGATNESGFTALPGGERSPGGSFLTLRGSGFWWSSSQGAISFAWSRTLNYNRGQVGRLNYDKPYGCAVRCIKGN